MSCVADPVPPTIVTSRLLPGERPEVFSWAQVRLGGLRGSTFASIGALLMIGDRLARRRRRQKLRRGSAEVGFPLDRHMAMLVTSQRLLIWRASRLPRRVHELIGERDLDQITAAALPYSGGGAWRSAVVETQEGVRVRFLVESAIADDFVAALRADPAG